MRIGVLGTFVWDTIHHPAVSGDPIEQWGGLAYALSGFAGAAGAGVTIVPIVRIGADLAPLATAFLDRLPADIDSLGVRVVPEPNNRVELRYLDLHERQERLTGGVGAWSWGELEPILESLDAVYVNFLSGMEMDLSVAEGFRDVPMPVYADLHSLFLGPPGDGARAPRELPEAERWLRCFDAVQMNETELGLLGGADPPMEMLRRLPLLGPELALVTMGASGAAYAACSPEVGPAGWPARRGDRLTGHPREETRATPIAGDVPLSLPPLAADPTGCGDVWGSVVFASLCAGLDTRTSIRRGHAAAAAKMAAPGIEGLASRIRQALR